MLRRILALSPIQEFIHWPMNSSNIEHMAYMQIPNHTLQDHDLVPVVRLALFRLPTGLMVLVNWSILYTRLCPCFRYAWKKTIHEADAGIY